MSVLMEMFAVQSELLDAIARDLRNASDRWPDPDAVDRVRHAAKLLEDVAGCERDEVARRLLSEVGA